MYTYYALNVYVAHFGDIVSFTKQLQNRAHTAKLRQTDRLQIMFEDFSVIQKAWKSVSDHTKCMQVSANHSTNFEIDHG